MNIAELRKKSSDELQSLLLELAREKFNLRMQQCTGQLSKPSQMKSVRRQIARVKTILTEMEVSKS
jgi:large subunit ribosomal protein L29